MATLVLAFNLTFLSPFGGGIFTLLWCNGEKRISGASVGASVGIRALACTPGRNCGCQCHLWRHRDPAGLQFLPAVRLAGASVSRAALEVFGASHIQPARRRMPHVLWTDSMTLIWNLLIGGRMGRYTGSPDTLVLDQRVEVRGFSAGSFAGLCTLQLLWKIPNVLTNGKLGAIAWPPQLLYTPGT